MTPSIGTKGTKFVESDLLALGPGLTRTELAEAEQVARRLHGELKACVALLPEGERGGSAMSRSLNLDRATCQRLVATTSKPDAGAGTLVQLPGVQGLRQFLGAMRLRTHDEDGQEQLTAAEAAVDRLETLIGELGGSQRRLRARLAGGGTEPEARSGAANDDVRLRETLFRAGAAVTGRWSETSVSLSIIQPTPGPSGAAGEPGPTATTQTVRLRAVLGHNARVDAVPLEVGSANPLDASAGGTPAAHRAPATLLEGFCSRPMPRLVSHTAGYRVVHVIDSAEPGPIENADVVLADREPVVDRHPALMTPPMGEVWSLINFPSRRLLMDVFLHRELAERCQASLEVHMWTPNVVQHAATRWSTRFPGGPRLLNLGSGLEGAASPSYARHAELVAHMFARMGLDAGSFVGYRCEVEFPIWRAGYCLAFDFGARETNGDK